jgi:hypothetical protein
VAEVIRSVGKYVSYFWWLAQLHRPPVQHTNFFYLSIVGYTPFSPQRE